MLSVNRQLNGHGDSDGDGTCKRTFRLVCTVYSKVAFFERTVNFFST